MFAINTSAEAGKNGKSGKIGIKRARRGARQGFTLITVLLISVMAFVLIASISHMFNVSSGSARATAAQAETYNLLQSGVEEGKAHLRKYMRKSFTESPLKCRYDGDDPLVFPSAEGSGINDEIDELLLIRNPDDADTPGNEDTTADGERFTNGFGVVSSDVHTIAGKRYLFRVRIYDMLYKTDASSFNAYGADSYKIIERMPQRMLFHGSGSDNDATVLAPHEDPAKETNAGVYLVRSSLEEMSDSSVKNGGAVYMIESAVVQAIAEHE